MGAEKDQLFPDIHRYAPLAYGIGTLADETLQAGLLFVSARGEIVQYRSRFADNRYKDMTQIG